MLQTMVRVVRLAPVLVLASLAHAQLQPVWEQFVPANYGPPHVAVSPAGECVLARTIQGPGPNVYRIELARFASNGVTLWTRTLPTAASTASAVDVAFDPASGDALVLSSEGTDYPASIALDVVLTRVDATGAIVWSTNYSTAESDVGLRLVLDPAGAIWVLGRTTTMLPHPVPAPFLLRFTSTGQLVGALVLAAAHDGIELVAHPQGGVVAVIEFGTFTTGRRFEIERYDAAGALTWTRDMPSALSNRVPRHRVACDAQGRTFACGRAATLGGDVAWVGAFDANGAPLWTTTFDDGTSDADEFTDLALDPAGGVLAAGAVGENWTFTSRGCLAAFDALGALRWSRVLDGPLGGALEFDALAVDAFGGTLAAGFVYDAGPMSAVFVRHDRDGNERGRRTTAYSVSDSAWASDVFALGAGDFLYTGNRYYWPAEMFEPFLGRVHDQGVPFCFGDGSAAACPCANASGVLEQAGCRNSLGVAATLRDEGVASLAGDTLTLRTQRTNATSPTSFVQATQPLVGGAVKASRASRATRSRCARSGRTRRRRRASCRRRSRSSAARCSATGSCVSVERSCACARSRRRAGARRSARGARPRSRRSAP